MTTDEASSSNNASGPMSPELSELLEGLSCASTGGERKQQQQRGPLLGRSVSFPEDEKLECYSEGPDIDVLAANRREIWYQYEELKHIKRKALVLSKEAQRYGLGSILTNTYGKASTDTQTALQTWVRNASSRRGLERWINDEYAAKRSDIRKRTIQSVLRAQAKMHESAIKDADYSMKVLSRLSEAFSVDSKEFARGMGVADEISLQEPCSEIDSVDDDISHASDKIKQMDPMALRKAPMAPLRNLASPRGVLPKGIPLKGRAPSRGLGLSNATSADFRHFY